MEGRDVAAVPRMAAQLSGCLKAGRVMEEVAGLSRRVFPEALLLSISVPSAGLINNLLIGCNNFLKEGHTLCSLASFHASSAGLSFSRRELFDSAQPRHTAGMDEPVHRLLDAEDAYKKWGVDRLLCCPIPLSLAAAIAQQPVDGDDAAAACGTTPQAVLGVVTLGLRKGAPMTAEVTEALQELARQLAETIERDSQALVDEVCMYALGRVRDTDDPPCARMSPTCSDETQPGGGTGGSAPSSGSQGIPVIPDGNVGAGAGGGGESGSPVAGAGAGGKGAGGRHSRTMICGQAKGQSKAYDEEWGAMLATCLPPRPAAPIIAAGGAAPANIGTGGEAAVNRSANEDTAMGWDPRSRQRRSRSLGAGSSSGGNGEAELSWDADLKQRIRGIDTFDAATAGAARSAFEAAACKRAGRKKDLCFARTSWLTFKDERMEAKFVAFHAAKRWRVDAAFLFLLAFICGMAGYTGAEIGLARHSATACAVHALPLLITVCRLPWYLRHREAVLAVWLVAAAAITVFATGRDALRVSTGGGLSSLIGFSRAHSAEPLLFHALMLAVRVRTALAVQVVCVAVAASNAAAVCATCCVPLLSPTFCLLKAYATQAVFGYGLPLLILYFTEDSFRYVFAEITKYSD